MDDWEIAPQAVVPIGDAGGQPSLADVIARLPPDLQEQVRDFAEFLLERRARRQPGRSLGDLLAQHGSIADLPDR
jgi:hypothetical protein